MKNTLFIGNGINMLTENSPSWKDMLEGILKSMNKENVVSFDEEQYPLIYEEIYTRGKRYRKWDEAKIKNKIYEISDQIKRNKYHSKCMSLPFDNILTTNYDYNLENSFESQPQNKNSEDKYSLFRKQEVGDKKVWHIHGELDTKNSIMLGYEHYSRAIQQMLNYVTNKSPYLRGIKEFENEKYYSWIDIFLRDNIHIVGFGFDFSEIDLWWLLTFRNRKILENNLECGTINYYYFDKDDDKKLKAKIDMLEVLGVNIVQIDMNKVKGEGLYRSAWDILLEEHLEKCFDSNIALLEAA